MPNLIQSLQGRDIGHLRIIAQLWGIDLVASLKEPALKELASKLLDATLVAEILGSLSAVNQVALEALEKANGKLPWATFSRRFGEIRDAGPGQRDRAQIYENPISPSEVLFYRAFLARAFFDLSTGIQEYAYIPDDLLPLINFETTKEDKNIIINVSNSVLNSKPLGHPSSPKDREHPLAISDCLLDDATTLLAALRMGLQPSNTRIPISVIGEFLSAARIIMDGKPQIEPVRIFFETSRKKALEHLVISWRDSESFNELRQMRDIICEGEWNNQPRIVRNFLLKLLEVIPKNIWWSLPSFIRAIKEKYPDFQRPAGDYDSWFIRRTSDGGYLRGFGVWDEVDGALIYYFITGPLYWLGKVELATTGRNEIVSAFRIKNNSYQILDDKNAKLHVSSQGIITVPRKFSRAARYQISRFCEWDEEKEDKYHYRVTIESLKKAGEQGLKVNHLLSLLAKKTAVEIPPPFVNALKRWENKGTEARMEVQTVLRVSRPEILEELNKSKAKRFLGETLGPVTTVVKHGAEPKVLAALAEMGLLTENLTPLSGRSGVKK